MKYKHLFFDLDNTLWNFNENSKAVVQILFFRYGADKYFESFQQYFDIYIEHNEYLWSLYGAGKITKEQLSDERFYYPFQEKNEVTKAIADNILNDYLPMLAQQTRLIDGAIEILEYAKSKGYIMHIVSNGFTEVQYIKLKNSGLDKYFTNIYLSEQIKEHKPSLLFFNHAIKSSNARKAESLVIGDNFDADIVGAKNAKIDQVYFNPLLNDSLKFEPTYKIKSLIELKNII